MKQYVCIVLYCIIRGEEERGKPNLFVIDVEVDIKEVPKAEEGSKHYGVQQLLRLPSLSLHVTTTTTTSVGGCFNLESIGLS